MKTEKLPVFYIRDFEQNSTEGSPFYINRFGEHLLQNTFLSWPYRHDFYIVIYFLSGGGKITVDFEEFQLKKGDIYIMVPGQVHNYNVKDQTDGYILFFNREMISGQTSAKLVSEFSILRPGSLFLNIAGDSENGKKIIYCFDEMMQEIRNKQSGSQSIIRDFLDILLHYFSRGIPRAPQKSGLSIPSWQLLELEKLIDDNYLKHYPPSFYADRLHLSTKYLNQLCKKHLVKTTTQLIHERVALEAKRLLAYQHLNSNEVANRLNFEDLSYFTRFFKKVTGITPGVFRKQYQR